MKNNAIVKDLNRVAQLIYDKKGFNILVLDVQGICTMTDYFIIAEGTVDRHVKAISQAIVADFASRDVEPFHLEGQQEGDWVVLDYGAFVIHLFIPDLREKYALEKLWQKGHVVDVEIHTVGQEVKFS